MPITAEPDVLLDRSRMALPKDQPALTTLDLAAEALRTENTAGSFFTEERRNFPALADYNPLDDVEGHYLDYAEQFAEANSPQEVAFLKSKIDSQLERRQRLASGGAKAIGFQMAATLLDPIELAMLAVPGGQGRTGANVTRLIAEATAATAVSESVLRATQPVRTAQESTLNITGTALLTGVMGASLKGLSKKRADQLAEAVHKEIHGGLDSVGAAATRGTNLEQETEVSALGLQKVAVSAFGRTVKSASVTARSVAQSIAESNRLFRKNEQGIASEISLETLKKRETGLLADNLFRNHSEFKDYRKGGGALSKTEFNEQVSMALRRGDVADDPMIEAAAKRWRGFFDRYKQQAQELGLLPDDIKVSTAKSYLTRVYRTDLIKQNRNEWDEIVTDWIMRTSDAEEAEAGTLANEITRNIMGSPAGLVPRDIVPKAGPLKDRVFNIDDELIEKFLESDITRVAEIYQRSMVPEILLTRRFGSRDLQDELDRVSQEYGALREKAKDKPQTLKRLQKEEARALKDIEAMRDMFLETYGRPTDPDSFFVKATRAMRTYNFVRMLGGMTISAIPDLARPVMQQGLLPTAKAMMKMAMAPARTRMAMLEARKFGVGLDMVMNTRAASIADVGEDLGHKMDRVLNGASKGFSVLTLMAPWNATLKQLNGVMVADNILGQVQRLSTEGLSKAKIKKLANAGINESTARQIAKQFEKYGDKGTLKLGGSDKWDNVAAREAFEAAVLKEVDSIIVTPGIADKPSFMSGELGKTAMQFRSFAFASANRILISGLQQRDMAQLNGLMLSIALGGLVYATKEHTAGRTPTDDPATFLNNAIDRSGVTGYLWDVKNVYEKLSGNVLFGNQTVSRYQSRNTVGALLGPSIGTAGDIAKVFRAVNEEQPLRSDIKAARRLIPYQNLFYLQKIFNHLEEGAVNSAGANQ